MGVQVVTACPAENEKAEKAKQKQEAGFGRLAVFDIGRIIHFVKVVVLMRCVHSFEERNCGPKILFPRL